MRRSAGRAIELLVSAGALPETTGKKRDRSFAYRTYLDRLRVGTELEGARRTSAFIWPSVKTQPRMGRLLDAALKYDRCEAA